MKLTKENVYINLQGKSEAELTELYNFLESIGENQCLSLERLINENGGWDYFIWGRYNQWTLTVLKGSRKEVTIQQLKEILQPTETLQEKEKRLLKELEEVRKEIEESKIKVGDWVWSNFSKCYYKKTSRISDLEERKITNPELIKLLEQEIK